MKLPYSLITSLFLGLLLLGSGCKTSSKTRSGDNVSVTKTKSKGSVLDNITKSTNLTGLVSDMTGSFISENVMAADSTFQNILLHTVPIWSSRSSKYLYVEQAIEGQESTPLKQQIYELLKDNDGGFEIKRYKLTNSDTVVGKWKSPAYFDQFDLSILDEEEGCTLYVIQHADGSYSGSTRMDHCINSDNGASYASTILKVRKGRIMSWEQGFNTDKVQVWGAKKGGYQFLRK